MQIFGLTGGIAAGKSTVSGMLKRAGIPVIDADTLARLVVDKDSPGLALVVDHFGSDYVLADGSLNRTKLAELIFSDAKKRRELEEITHPLIAEKLLFEINKLKELDCKFVVYEAPLLFETASYKRFNATLLVDVPQEVQIKRLTNRNHLSVDEAQKRIASQMPRQQKTALADAILDNSQDLIHTAFQLRQIWFNLTGQDIVFEPA